MNLYICDDNINELNKEVALVKEYSQMKGIDFTIYTSDNGEKLLDEINLDVDIYILDVLMPDMNGILLAERIREIKPLVPIIFTTSSEEYALKAYGVCALRYLVKPLKLSALQEALDFVLTLVRTEKKNYIVATSQGDVAVNLSEIEYVENLSRVMMFHIKDGNIYKSKFIRDSFDKQIKNIQDDRHFLRVHKSYIVNMDCIRIYGTNNVVMESGDNIPISRNNLDMAKKRYFEYILKA